MDRAETHSSAVYRVHGEEARVPKVTVLVPSLDGYRGGNVPFLINQLKNQTFKDLEVVVVRGVRPNGRARNEGARMARGEFLVSIDDDVTLGHDRVIENLVRCLESDQSLGLLGISKLIPENSSWFQRRIAIEIPRSVSPVYDRLTDGDLVDHVCHAIRRDLFFRIGMENENIVRGTDPDLRYRLKKAGYRVAICPDSWGYHPVPRTFSKLLRMSFYSGMGSAWVQRHYPEYAIHDSEEHTAVFQEKTTLPYRMRYSVVRLVKCLMKGHFFYAAARISYAMGYLYSLWTGKSGDAWFDRKQLSRETAT
ncbi:MAG TPA: glycosyltransferase [Syntrophales bacterium]|jgi:glycosyltransferase involved in cell wall biosynthesis|nr:glycosyltransferase [Syntrophales bacterium]